MTYTITITMADGGQFTYSPSTLNVTTGDTVGWTSGTLGPFAISFLDATPFSGVGFSSSKGNSGEHSIAPLEIKKHRIGHHHYAVSVANLPAGGTDFVVYLDSGCPDIVVSDGSGL